MPVLISPKLILFFQLPIVFRYFHGSVIGWKAVKTCKAAMNFLSL
ncbi:hypothetical protein ADICYQ_5082 [Cyclobacterium qasimii M12-11B]|uniref:Uncharacterized protein n=1 Tax=Cyclobacterium qasimii M12-11B TaxID=641524 RepID=S7V8N0_9BACT|nr:hypothetical protein ADICYQ_5082 [Cyclobacterium qasimii M12-11B]